MNSQEVLARIEEIGIIPAARFASQADALFASQVIFDAGIPIVEITMTIPGALEAIEKLLHSQPHAIVGAGTVLDLKTAKSCVDAGVSFLTSTGLDMEMLRFGQEHGVAVIPGALTPSEIMQAHKAGAEFIKIFPCSAMGGTEYIRTLKGPFPHSRFIASGGVNQQTAAEFIRAGASAIGVGQDLLPHEAIRQRNEDWIRELARRFVGMVHTGRSR